MRYEVDRYFRRAHASAKYHGDANSRIKVGTGKISGGINGQGYSCAPNGGNLKKADMGGKVREIRSLCLCQRLELLCLRSGKALNLSCMKIAFLNRGYWTPRRKRQQDSKLAIYKLADVPLYTQSSLRTLHAFLNLCTQIVPDFLQDVVKRFG